MREVPSVRFCAGILLSIALAACGAPSRGGPDGGHDVTGEAPDAGGGEEGGPDAGDSTCHAGAACVPANACHKGQVACTASGPSCEDTGQAVSNGTSCGSGAVCHAGSCGACAAGTACTDGIPECRVGAIDCRSGLPVCHYAGPMEDGTACGNGGACKGGICAKTCHDDCSAEGAMSCAAGATKTCTSGADGCRHWSTPTSCAAGSTCAADGQHCAKQGSWTLLVYMVADNNLEVDAVPNIAQMADVGSSGKLDIVVELGRDLQYDTSPTLNLPAVDGTQRLHVRKNAVDLLEDRGTAVDTGTPEELADFLSYGASHYPSEHVALVLWDHGGAWQGFGWSDRTGSHLALPDLAQGIGDGLQAAGLPRLDLLGFDACMMGNYEVLSALAPFTHYYLGSEELEPGAGWDYRSFAGLATGTDVVTVGRAVVDGFLAANPDPTSTLSLVDATKLAPVHQAVQALSSAVVPRIATLAPPLGRARAAALSFGSNPDPAADFFLVDAGQLLRLAAAADAADYAGLSSTLDTALQGAVLYSRTGSAYTDAEGLSVYFPPTQADYAQGDYRGLTGIDAWRRLLEAYLAQGLAAPVPGFSGPATTTAAAAGVTVSGPLAVGSSSQVVLASLSFGYSFPESAAGAGDDDVDFYGDVTAAFDATHAFGTWNHELAALEQGSDWGYAYASRDAAAGGNTTIDIPLAYLPPGAADCSADTVQIASRHVVLDASGNVVADTLYSTDAGATSELHPQSGGRLQILLYYEVGSHELSRPATDEGWYCAGPVFAADQPIALEFVAPELDAGVREIAVLSVENVGGQGDSVVVVGPFGVP